MLKNKIFEMAGEIYSLELETENYIDDIQPQRLEEFEGTTEERLDKATKQMMLRQEEIESVVRTLANKFDITHPKTYSQIKEIAILYLFQKELHKKAMAEIKIDKTRNKNTTKDWFSEHRKYSELVSKLLGKVYIPPVAKADDLPSQHDMWKTDKYIIID